ncbi:MAG: ATP-binding protein [Pseudomonadota bacterium]
MKGPEKPNPQVSIRLPALMENLPRFIEPVSAAARALGIGEEKCADLELALEEALVNIFSYAYPETPGFVTVSCRTEADGFVLLLEDEGIAFSMMAASPPDLNRDMADRKIGGLGIHLIKTLMDEVRYRREGNRNMLELILFMHGKEEGR